MKKIVLFGGSFDPPHPGHFDMGDYLWKTLEADEVWFLLSHNPHKGNQQYASTPHRKAMGEILMKQYPDRPFVMSDIQDQINTHITYDVLTALKEIYPDMHFVWAMGADSMASFHTWDNYNDIIETTPIAVVDRPGYTTKAANSYAALSYAHLQTPKAANLFDGHNGWHFLENPKIDLSSSNLLRQLSIGDNNFDLRFKDVASYIKENKLYQLTAPTSKLRLPGLVRD